MTCVYYICHMCIVIVLFTFILIINPFHKTIIQKHRGGLRNEKQRHGIMAQLQGTALIEDEGNDVPSGSSSGSHRLAINNVNDRLTKEFKANPNDGDTVKPEEVHTVDVGVLLHQVEEGDYNEEENNDYGYGHDPKYEGVNDNHDDHSIHESERYLEVVGDVCPDELQVVCVDGLVDDGRSCAEACDGKCCVGTDACTGFSGSVCKDGSSCSGGKACSNATTLDQFCVGVMVLGLVSGLPMMEYRSDQLSTRVMMSLHAARLPVEVDRSDH